MPSSDRAINSLHTLLRDDHTREQFLPPLTNVERSAVERLLPTIWDSANEWMTQYPFLNGEALLPITVLKIAQMPQLEATDIATSVQWELWALTLDDLFDRRHASFEQLGAIAADCHEVALAPPGMEHATTPFGSALSDIKGQLARHRTFQELHPAFVSGLVRLMDGFFYAYAVRPSTQMEGAPRIHLDDYLLRGSWTTLHPFIWCLPLYDDETVMPNLPALAQLAEQCSRVLRLANDLATWDRETTEGAFNAVALERANLAGSGCGWSDEERLAKALNEIRLCLARERRRVYELGDQISTRRGVETGLVRLTELATDMYERRDIRKWRHLLGNGHTPDA